MRIWAFSWAVPPLRSARVHLVRVRVRVRVRVKVSPNPNQVGEAALAEAEREGVERAHLHAALAHLG